MRKRPAVQIIAVCAVMLTAATPVLAAKAILRRGFIPGDVPQLPCTIQIDFTSTANGVDHDAFQPILGYIVDTRDVDEAEAWGWGKAGEFSLCLKVLDLKEAPKILTELQTLSAKSLTPGKGPVVVVRGSEWK